MLIKNRLPSDVCDQTNSNGRHVTFCHSLFGISSRDFMCARVYHLILCIYSTAFFHSLKFWGKLLGIMETMKSRDNWYSGLQIRGAEVRGACV